MTCSATRTAGRTVFAGPTWRRRTKNEGQDRRPPKSRWPLRPGRTVGPHGMPQTTAPGTPNNQKEIDVSPNNHFLFKGFQLPYWNNHLFLVGTGVPGGFFFLAKPPHFSPCPAGASKRCLGRSHELVRCPVPKRSEDRGCPEPRHIHGPLEDEPHHPTPCDYFDLSSHVGVEWVDRFVVGATRWPSSLGVTHELAKTAG